MRVLGHMMLCQEQSKIDKEKEHFDLLKDITVTGEGTANVHM